MFRTRLKIGKRHNASSNFHSLKYHKKLITRCDCERELFQRHRTRTTKYKTYCPTKRKFWIWK